MFQTPPPRGQTLDFGPLGGRFETQKRIQALIQWECASFEAILS